MNKIKIDEIAERILTLRYHPISTFNEYLKVSNVKEVSSLISDKQMVDEILNDHQQLLQQMNRVITAADKSGDEGTIDLIGAYVRELEKASWMLDAWRQDTRDQLKTMKAEELA